MNIEQVRTYCLSKPESTEDLPFGPDVLVFKVVNKMFALTNPEQIPLSINLKCDPDRALALRAQYASVQPGYHMNKKHWNTVIIDGSLSISEIRELIDHSYDLVVSSLKKADRERLLS